MAYDPTAIPAISGQLRRGIFISTVHRKPTAITFRAVDYTGRVSMPSLKRKMELSGFTEEVADLELMIYLPTNTARPQAQSADRVTVHEKDASGASISDFVYRITDVQTDLAPDCYTLTLAKQRT